MDPNETLRQLRQLCDEAENGADVSDELAEHVRAIDGWLSKGGFLPAAWSR